MSNRIKIEIEIRPEILEALEITKEVCSDWLSEVDEMGSPDTFLEKIIITGYTAWGRDSANEKISEELYQKFKELNKRFFYLRMKESGDKFKEWSINKVMENKILQAVENISGIINDKVH